MTVNSIPLILEGFMGDDETINEALRITIQALEELECYRATGSTPTQILERIGGLDIELGKYYSLGTVEELKEAKRFKQYFDELYGEGLEVANWHKNGDLEPFDTFYESALDWEEGGTSD